MATLADMRASVQLGDSSRAGGYWGQAVTHYQAAGMMGATDVGPAIDKRTGGATAGLTQRAWDMNGLLANLNSSDSAISDDADQAKKFIDQMMSWYTAANAYSVAPAAHADVKLPALVPTSTILPVYGPMPTAPPVAPVAAPPPPPPRPVAVAVAPKVTTYVPTGPLSVKRVQPVSRKNVIAAALVGAGGFAAVHTIPGLIIGALIGGIGSKVLLKW